jgi:hypothetical protein
LTITLKKLNPVAWQSKRERWKKVDWFSNFGWTFTAEARRRRGGLIRKRGKTVSIELENMRILLPVVGLLAMTIRRVIRDS